MPARTQLEVEADEPEYWPIGVDGSRTIEVIVRDPDHDGTALFKFGMVPTLGMRIVTFTAFSNQGFKASLKDLPVSRWEKVARAAAERRLMAAWAPTGSMLRPKTQPEASSTRSSPSSRTPVGATPSVGATA